MQNTFRYWKLFLCEIVTLRKRHFILKTGIQKRKYICIQYILPEVYILLNCTFGLININTFQSFIQFLLKYWSPVVPNLIFFPLKTCPWRGCHRSFLCLGYISLNCPTSATRWKQPLLSGAATQLIIFFFLRFASIVGDVK